MFLQFEDKREERKLAFYPERDENRKFSFLRAKNKIYNEEFDPGSG